MRAYTHGSKKSTDINVRARITILREIGVGANAKVPTLGHAMLSSLPAANAQVLQRTYGQLEDEIAVRRGGVPGLAVSGVSMQAVRAAQLAAVTAANLRNHETGNGSAMAVEGGSDAASASSSAATSGSLKRKRQETGSGRTGKELVAMAVAIGKTPGMQDMGLDAMGIDDPDFLTKGFVPSSSPSAKPFSVLDQYKALVRHFSTAGNPPPPFIYTQPMTDQLKVLCGPHLASQSIAAAASSSAAATDSTGVASTATMPGDSETIESGKSKRRKADGDAMETTPVKADLASEADPKSVEISSSATRTSKRSSRRR